jgi:hypothetical protein
MTSLDHIHLKLRSDLQLLKGSNPWGTNAKRQAAESTWWYLIAKRS